MRKIEVVAIGASAGGVETFKKLVGRLPADFSPAILIVQHFPETSRSFLPAILERCGRLPATHASHGQRLEAGKVFVAPPGFHMLIKDGVFCLNRGPKENANRPAIDPTFRTAAQCYGPRLAAVLLSGLLDDGSVGMSSAKAAGAVTIVQHPEEALYSDMPRNAMNQVDLDHVLPVEEIVDLLKEIAHPNSRPDICAADSQEDDPTEMSLDELQNMESDWKVSALTCPECNGSLFEVKWEDVSNFRCRVGHAYSNETLLDAQNQALEAAMWAALRALEENVSLLKRLTENAVSKGHDFSQKQFSQRLEEQKSRIRLLKSALRVVETEQNAG